MKIAILSSGAGHYNRGIETISTNLAYLLKSKGVDITFFKGGGRKDSDFERVIPCIKMNSQLLWGAYSRLSWGFRHLIQQYSFIILALPFLRNYDIIQTSDYRVARIIKRAEKIGLVKKRLLFMDGNIFNLEKLRGFEYVQETAQHYVDEASKIGLDTKTWFVIPHFVDTTLFKPSTDNLRDTLEFDENTFVVLSVGSVENDYKRMRWVIDELATLIKKTDREIHLVICGEKEAESEDIVNHGKSSLGENIHFLFNMPFREMPKVYNTCDVFVLGSVIERFGLAFIEAMACEVPAIGHTFPVTEWILGEGGENVDMTKKGSLASSLEKYMDSSFREEKGKVARKRVEEMFSPDFVAEKFSYMYNQILQE